MTSVKCSVCSAPHRVPDDCLDGDIFYAPCGADLQVVRGTIYNGNTGIESPFCVFKVVSFCEECGQQRDDDGLDRNYCDTCKEEMARQVQ